jgi:hypothetical protein
VGGCFEKSSIKVGYYYLLVGQLSLLSKMFAQSIQLRPEMSESQRVLQWQIALQDQSRLQFHTIGNTEPAMQGRYKAQT